VTATGALLLVCAGVLAGLLSTVVSLASVVSYPALLAAGLPPLSANVTNTVALTFTAIGSVFGSRVELAGQGRRVLRLGVLTALGGAAGAGLLLLTPPRTFQLAAPVLIGAAAVVLFVQPAVPRLAHSRRYERSPWLRAGVFGTAVYVGYFGAAGGILMLAALAPMLDQPLARTNAVKNAIGGLANGIAAVGFVVFGPVRWAAAAPLAAGFLVGGWLGPAVVRRLPSQTLRVLVGLCGLVVAAKLGLDTYR
jgi:uncharacterized membrane protein YfcA